MKKDRLVYVLLNKNRIYTYQYGIYSFDAEPFYVGVSTQRWLAYNVNRLSFLKDYPNYEICESINKEYSQEEAFQLQQKIITAVTRKPYGPLENRSHSGASQLWKVKFKASGEEEVVPSLRKYALKKGIKASKLYSAWRSKQKGYKDTIYPFIVERLTN